MVYTAVMFNIHHQMHFRCMALWDARMCSLPTLVLTSHRRGLLHQPRSTLVHVKLCTGDQ